MRKGWKLRKGEWPGERWTGAAEVWRRSCGLSNGTVGWQFKGETKRERNE